MKFCKTNSTWGLTTVALSIMIVQGCSDEPRRDSAATGSTSSSSSTSGDGGSMPDGGVTGGSGGMGASGGTGGIGGSGGMGASGGTGGIGGVGGAVSSSSSSGGSSSGSSSGTGGMGGGGGGGGGGVTCTMDPSGVVSGTSLIGPSEAIVALCEAKTLVGNQLLKQLEIRDATGALSMSFPVAGKPVDIVYDVETDTAYATLFGATNLARVHLGTGVVTSIPLGGIGLRVALGNAGLVFVTLDDSATFPNRPLVIVNGPLATVEKTLMIPYGGSLITYHRPTNMLYTGDAGLSPSKLERYSFDSATKTVTLGQSRANTGNNGLNLSIAPNGMHIAFSCSQGNGTNPIDYKIHDINPADLNANFGLWNTGPYPVDAVFTADSTKLVASNGSELRRFDVATQAVLNNFVLASPCSSSDVRRVAVSPGGKINYALVKCGAIGDSGKLYWFVVP